MFPSWSYKVWSSCSISEGSHGWLVAATRSSTAGETSKADAGSARLVVSDFMTSASSSSPVGYFPFGVDFFFPAFLLTVFDLALSLASSAESTRSVLSTSVRPAMMRSAAKML